MNRININDTVRIRLNERGLEILRDEHEELRRHFPKVGPWKPPAVDEYGYSSFQLWQVMQHFGPNMYLGCVPPFGTEIVLP